MQEKNEPLPDRESLLKFMNVAVKRPKIPGVPYPGLDLVYRREYADEVFRTDKLTGGDGGSRVKSIIRELGRYGQISSSQTVDEWLSGRDIMPVSPL